MKTHTPRSLNRRALSRQALLGVVSFAAVSSIHAQATWVGDTSSDWNDATNWSSDPASPSGNFTINTSVGNYPLIGASSAFTPNDIIVGSGSGQSGRVDQSAGAVSTGAGNWLLIGTNGGIGEYNLSGGTLTAQDVHMARTGSGTSATATMNIANASLNTLGVIVVADGQSNTAAATGTVNVNGGGIVNSENDLVVAFAGNASTQGIVNIASGGVVNVASTTERWLIMNQWDSTRAQINVNGGALNLNANTDIRFATGSWGPGASDGASSITLNSGTITGGATSVIDLNHNADRAVSNTINLNGGTLTIGQIVSGKAIGSRVVNLNGGTLKAAASSATFIEDSAVSELNVLAGGAVIDTNGFDITIAKALTADLVSTGGGLTKEGLGALTLTGANTFTGDILIEGGSLSINSAFIDDAADVSLVTGVTFDLSFLGTDTIASLFIDGISQSIGTYGAIGSGAGFELPLFTGTGLLNVTTAIPEPSSFAALAGLGTLALAGARRRRR